MAEPAAFDRWLQSSGVPVAAIVKHVIAENVRLTTERLLLDGQRRGPHRALPARARDEPVSVGLAGRRAPRSREPAFDAAETLSRAIRLLQDRHVIGPGLEILDVDALRRIAKEDGEAASAERA